MHGRSWDQIKGCLRDSVLYSRRVHSLKVRVSGCGPVLVISVGRAVLPSTRTTNVTALIGSTLTTVLLVYGIARFVAFRLGYIHGKGQLGMYQPNAFDRVNQIMSLPILLILVISSLASLFISALITFRVPNQRTLYG